MPLLALLSAMLIAAATPAPPAPTAPPLRTIITVIGSPYCNSLADHFNDALVPLLGNDRALDAVDVQLIEMDTLFSQPDFVERYLRVRDALFHQETAINASLPGIKAEIGQLRAGAALTTDPQGALAVRNAADDLSTAYDRQRQLGIDLQTMYQSMMRYNVENAHPAMGGFDERDMEEPPAMRDVKTYLHFDNQRAVIANSEDQAVSVAYAAAQTYCVPKK